MGAKKLIRVISAEPLAEDAAGRIEAFFSKKHGENELYFKYECRKDLVGGVLIIDNGVYYDASIKAQLRAIKDLL